MIFRLKGILGTLQLYRLSKCLSTDGINCCKFTVSYYWPKWLWNYWLHHYSLHDTDDCVFILHLDEAHVQWVFFRKTKVLEKNSRLCLLYLLNLWPKFLCTFTFHSQKSKWNQTITSREYEIARQRQKCTSTEFYKHFLLSGENVINDF